MIKFRRFYRTRKPVTLISDLDTFEGKHESYYYDEVMFAYDGGEKVGQVARVGGWIYGLTVKPQYRKQGIASSLLKKICNDIPENSAWLIGAKNAVGFYKKQEGWVDFGALGKEASIDYGEPEDHLFGINLSKRKEWGIAGQAAFVLKKIRGLVDCETLNDVRGFTNNEDSNTPIRVLVQGKKKDNMFDTITMSLGMNSLDFEIDLKKKSIAKYL